MKKRKIILILMIVSITSLIYCKSTDSVSNMHENTMLLETENEESSDAGIDKIDTDTLYETWQDAYKSIILNAGDYLKDLEAAQNRRESELAENDLYVYLMLNDFNRDGCPELVLGDGISAGVFSLQDNQIKRVANLYVDENIWSEWGINGGHFINNCLYFQCDGSDGSCYICWTYYDGEYIVGIYDDYNPTQYIINEQETSCDTFNTIFNIKDMKNYQDNPIPRYRIDNNSETLVSIENQVEVTIMDFLQSHAALSIYNEINPIITIINDAEDVYIKPEKPYDPSYVRQLS